MSTSTPHPSYQRIQAPDPLPLPQSATTTIFLAGTCGPFAPDTSSSTESDNSHPPPPNPPPDKRTWRTVLSERLSHLPVTIIDPVPRGGWDTIGTESPSNPRFAAQVEWELQAQRCASVVVVYMQTGMVAGVSLLELGLALGRVEGQGQGGSESDGVNRVKKVVVCCEDGFWKKGNVIVTCLNSNASGNGDGDGKGKRVQVCGGFEEMVGIIEGVLGWRSRGGEGEEERKEVEEKAGVVC